MTDWTPEMVAKLRELWSDGYSATEIGRRMGLTKNQVVGKAHGLGLDGRASPIQRAALKQGAAAVTHAAAREPGNGLVIQRKRSAGPPKVVASLPPVVAEAPPAAAPAMARTVQELAAKVRASAVPRVAPMRAGEGCRYPLWGEERRPALRRFCDQPRRTGRDGVPNSAYCPACHELTHVEPRQQRLEDERLQWSVASAFARAAGR